MIVGIYSPRQDSFFFSLVGGLASEDSSITV